MEDTFKVWITKYVLTTGIEEKEVVASKNSPNMVSTAKYYTKHYHGEGIEWHRTLEGAIKRAEEMRIKKLQALDKQIKKINALNFE